MDRLLHIVLFFFYYVVVAPIALLLRLFRVTPLALTRGGRSYWVEKKRPSQSLREYRSIW